MDLFKLIGKDLSKVMTRSSSIKSPRVKEILHFIFASAVGVEWKEMKKCVVSHLSTRC